MVDLRNLLLFGHVTVEREQDRVVLTAQLL